MSRWEETHKLYESADRFYYNNNDTVERRSATEAVCSLSVSFGYNVSIFNQAIVYLDAVLFFKAVTLGQDTDVHFLKVNLVL
jgi:hypothetical protein